MPEELDILKNRAWHPQRPPNWRWQFASRLHQNPAFCGPELDDPGVLAAVMIQAAYRDHQSAAELAEMLRSGGDYTEAYSFWHSSISDELVAGPPSMGADSKDEFRAVSHSAISRAELEGMILTGSPADEIAAYAAITPSGISAYESMFFDVRSRLKQSNWISAQAVGSLHQTSPLTMIPSLIRAFGYQSRSLEIVRQVAETFRSELAVRSAEDDDSRFFENDRRMTNSMRAALASRMRPYNRYTYEKIIEVQNETLELDAKLKLSQGAQSEQEFRSAAAMLSAAMRPGYGEAPVNFAEERLREGPRLLVADQDLG